MDIFNEIQELTKDLNVSVKSLRKTGEDYARAYTNYRIALAKELLILKNEGYAITLAGDIARGKPEIAKLKFEEISKEAIYKANQEAINSTKLKIKIIQEQLNKEYSSDLPN
jgi:hypothetical protein